MEKMKKQKEKTLVDLFGMLFYEANEGVAENGQEKVKTRTQAATNLHRLFYVWTVERRVCVCDVSGVRMQAKRKKNRKKVEISIIPTLSFSSICSESFLFSVIPENM